MKFSMVVTHIFEPRDNIHIGAHASYKTSKMATTLHRLLSKLYSGLSGMSLAVFCCFLALFLLNDRLAGQEFTISDSAIAVEVLNTFDGSGNVYGMKTEVSGNGIGFQFGNSMTVSGTGHGSRFGMHTEIEGDGNGSHFGTHNIISSTGSGARYGVYNYLSEGSGLQCGNFTQIFNSNSSAQYGNYLILNGGGAGNHYGTYAILSGAGTGEQYGVYTDISTTSGADHYGNYTLLDGGGAGDHYGSHVTLAGSGSGIQYGTYNKITNTNNALHYGTYNTLESSGSGTHIGCRNVITNGNGFLYGTSSIITSTDGNSTHYGNYCSLSGSGDGTHYGAYHLVNGTGSGDHYGTFNWLASNNLGTNTAGYFYAAGVGNFAAIFQQGHVVANNAGLDYDFTVKGLDKDFQLFVDADAGTVGIGTAVPSDALHIVGEGTDDLLRVQLGTSTKMRIYNNGSISLGSNNTAIDAGDVYITNELGVQRSNPAFPIHVGTNGTNGNGAHVTAGGSWTNGSSREFKENFKAVDPEQILERLNDLNILRWNYKESNEGDHIGPMAEDFYAAFALGHDSHYISTVDADGVALAAIKGLYSKLLDAQNEIVYLENTLHAMQLDHEERFADLERTVCDLRTLVQEQVK
jgi:hypothetical protein